jgi:hypothetical protein
MQWRRPSITRARQLSWPPSTRLRHAHSVRPTASQTDGGGREPPHRPRPRAGVRGGAGGASGAGDAPRAHNGADALELQELHPERGRAANSWGSRGSPGTPWHPIEDPWALSR